MNKKNNLVEEWVRKAEHDLGMAILALEHKPEYADSICFHCQQSAEKYLKAVLVKLNVKFMKTHSLSYLLDLINDKVNVPEKIYDVAEELEGYAVEIRYPDDWFDPTVEEVKEAYRYAVNIKEFATELIAKFD